MNENYYLDLIKTKLSKNTISAYTFAIKQFLQKFSIFNRKNLMSYKSWLIDNYKPKTVNIRLNAINFYLNKIKKPNLKVQLVKIQQKPFLENIISQADYEYLKNKLKKDNKKWYFVVKFLACTGARVSELIKFKIEHLKLGYMDLFSKGGKLRIIYIPNSLQKEAIRWTDFENRDSGFLFVNRYGNQITPRGISGQLKIFATKYNLDKNVIYPHSFRHRFAKNFLSKCNDLAFLADLMGHESIETTRIYLRKTSVEQRLIVDDVIDW